MLLQHARMTTGFYACAQHDKERKREHDFSAVLHFRLITIGVLLHLWKQAERIDLQHLVSRSLPIIGTQKIYCTHVIASIVSSFSNVAVRGIACANINGTLKRYLL